MQLSNDDFIRYSRQILLPEIGEHGQLNFAKTHVVIIGVGGLGNLVAHYLAAAGIGKLTLVDGDKVERSNIPRQLLFNDNDCGKNKAMVAKQKLKMAYQQCDIQSIAEPISSTNGIAIINSAQLVLDCTDNFLTRQFINSLALTQNVPLVTASVASFQGQLLIVDQQNNPESGCYHCLYPADTKLSETCQTIGVLGPMVGIIASMQALLAIQMLVGNHQLIGKLYRFNGNDFTWRQVTLEKNSSCHVCNSLNSGNL